MPGHKLADGCLVASVQQQVALGVKNLGAVADGRAGETVAGAVPGQCSGCLRCFGDLASGFNPLVPSGLGAGDGDFGLLKQGLVDVGAGHGQLRHEAVDAFVRGRRAQPRQGGAEIGFHVGRVFQVRANVEVVLRQAAQVGHAGNVGALAGSELHGQLLDDAFVGHGVDDHLGAGVLRFKALGDGSGDLAFDAVLVAHDADVGGLRGQGEGGECGQCGQAGWGVS